MSEKLASIVILFAHPTVHRSRVNRVLFERVKAVPGVATRDLYELYPDFNIDVEAEQNALREADLVVFQHPIYWYSVPAILKEWMDVVLTRGFAYGSGGDALRGKDALLAVSTGGSAQAYTSAGQHRHPFEDLIRPLQQTAVFCGMRCLPPLVLHGGRGPVSKERLNEHAQRYTQLLIDYQQRGS